MRVLNQAAPAEAVILARSAGVACGSDGALYDTSDSHPERLFRPRPVTASH